LLPPKATNRERFAFVKEAIMMDRPEAGATASHNNLRLLTFAIILLCSLTTIAMQSAGAQTFTVLHSFTGGADGAAPSGITLDSAGNVYGTTYGGGIGDGTVFKLKHAGSGWVLNSLYTFQGGSDGSNPVATVVFGPSSILYGTTYQGRSEQ
jgi:uncharacterized repeat protein (TIGR03803 family)